MRSLKSFGNSLGLCVLAQKREEESNENEFEVVSYPREGCSNVKLFSFDLHLNLGRVVYMGKMSLRPPFRAEYVSKDQVHFRTDKNDGRWYSITVSECLELNPVVSEIRYQDEFKHEDQFIL